jgi:hypothetical protein
MLALETFLAWKVNMNIVLMMRIMVMSVKFVSIEIILVKANDDRTFFDSFDCD